MKIPSIVRLKGGLGNQMFQYCFGIWLENNFNIPVFFDARGLKNADQPRDLELLNFPTLRRQNEKFIINSDLYKKNLSSIIYRWGCRTNENKIEPIPKSFSYYEGFWQHLKYIDTKLIKKVFEFDGYPNLINIANQMQSEDSVAIHIRGKDYLNHLSLLQLTNNYYDQAINEINSKIKKPVYYLFTDDLLHSEKILKINNCITIKTISTISDFYLMSRCRNHIIANSTYSWWGAMLGTSENQIKIAPKIWDSETDCKINSEFILIENV